MSREFKFRVWNLTEKRWDAPSLLEVWNDENVLRTMYGSEGYLIQQAVGLTDSKGKEIYEGDLLKIVIAESGNEAVGEVSYTAFQFYLRMNFHNWHIPLSRLTNKLDKFVSYEVVGNICETPELITP